MPTVTVKELVDSVRVMSGLRNNKFYSDDEIASFIDDAAKQLYDKFVISNQHYFIKMFDFTLDASTSRVLLPTDFMKENLVVKNPGPQETYIDAVENFQNTAMQGGQTSPTFGPRWFISGDYLNFYPAQDCAGDYQLRYTPTQPDLSLGVLQNILTTPTHTVRLMSEEPMDLKGNWAFNDANSIGMETFPTFGGDPPGELFIDGERLVNGDLVLFTEEDAPLDPTNMGIWQFTNVGGSGGDTLIYQFQRPTGLENPTGYLLTSDIIAVTDGFVFGKTYWHPDNIIVLGTTSSTLSSPNRIDFNGNATNFILRTVNGNFDSTLADGKVNISGSKTNANNGSWNIGAAGTDDGDSALFVVDSTSTLRPEAFSWDTVISVNPPGTVAITPTILLPWILYLKVHASIAVRTGRAQETNELQLKLQQQENRISAMASNRTERVVQAPITRSWAGPWGNTGGNTF